MNKVKLIKKIYIKLIKILMLIKIIILSMVYKNKVYIFGTPIHGNLGDQAILLGEIKFLKDNFKNIKIIEVESSLVTKCNKMLKKLIGKSLILVHGGGFLGTLWLHEEKMFRIVLRTFTNNTIIVFPQTIYFSNDMEGKKILEESQSIYQTHKHLYICCREEYSYKFMKKEFPLCNVLLIPDMVLYMDKLQENNDRQNILFCIRKDKEKVQYNLAALKDMLKNEYGVSIDDTDTVIQENIYSLKRSKKKVTEKIEQFQKYKLVVTDRLHGMVFAYLSKTPCLVFQNKSYKVKGLYEWIKACNYIELVDENNMMDASRKLLNIKEEHGVDLKDRYIPLIQLIRKSIEIFK